MGDLSWQRVLLMVAALGVGLTCVDASDEAETTATSAGALSVRSARNGGSAVYPDNYLKPATVQGHNFGKLWHYDVDGLIYAQPLVLDSVSVPGVGTRNVVYVATNNNTLYAFDADNYAAPLWTRHFDGDLFDSTFDCPSPTDNACLAYGFYQSRFKAGIWGTPAISGNTMYVVSKTDPTPEFRQPHGMNVNLWAIDVATGAIIRGMPMGGTFPDANGDLMSFDNFYHNQRPGLLVQNGIVYVGFGANNDQGPWSGWLFAYDASTLNRVATFCTNCQYPRSDGWMGGGIWQAGAGIVGDGNNVYFMTGNGSTDLDTSLSSSFVRFDVTNIGTMGFKGVSFRAGDPTETWGFTAPHLNEWDLDLGSSGPLLVSGTNLVTGVGKEGLMYLLDRNSLQLTQNPPKRVATNIYLDACSGAALPAPLARSEHPRTCTPPQTFLATGWSLGTYPHVHGVPVYWQAKNALYVWAEKDYLRRYHLAGNQLTHSVYDMPASDVSGAPPALGGNSMPGGMLSLSTNSDGSGIIWAATRHRPEVVGSGDTTGTGIVRAIDADSLNELWSTDVPFAFPKFPALTISNGKLYIPTNGNQLQVYGKIDRAASVVAPASNRLDMVIRGTDGAVQHKSWDGSAWQPSMGGAFASLGGSPVGSPVLVSVPVSGGSPRLEVFIRRADNTIAHRFRTGSGWQFPSQSWASLGGTIVGPPSAVSWGINRIDVFGEWTDHTVRTISWNGSSWSPTAWKNLGSPLGKPIRGPIKAVSRAANKIDLFAVGSDGALYTKKWTGGPNWIPSDTDWTSLGGNVVGVPTAVPVNASRVDVFARGTNGGIFWKFWDGTNWQPSTTTWTALTSPPGERGGRDGIADVPRAVLSGPNQISLFAQSADGSTYTINYNTSSGWALPWRQLNLEVVGTPEPTSWAANRIDVFTKGTDDAIYARSSLDGGATWIPSNGWTAMGGRVAF